MNAIKQWLRSADEYCFGYGSATTIGLIRLIGGFLLFVNQVIIGVFWQDWYGEKGYIPSWLGAIWFGFKVPIPAPIRDLAPDGVPRINLLYGVTDPRITITFYVIVTIAALFTCLGLFSRYSAFVLAIGLITLHHRSGPFLHGGDSVMRLVAIYLAVSPVGESCSIDRLIGLWKGRITHEPKLISMWSQRLIGYNTALIYFTTVWLKWDGDRWRNFTAVYYPSRLAEFYRFPLPDFFRSMWFAKIATFATVATEFSMATLVFFPPARRYVIFGGIIMHSWIEYSMNIPLFSFIMMTTYLAFFQGEEIQAWAQRMGTRMRKFHVVLRLPKERKLTPNATAFLSSIDPFGLVSYLPGETDSFTAERFGGSPISPTTAVLTRSLGGWPFLWWPGALPKLLSRATEPIPPTSIKQASEQKMSKEPAGAPSRRKRR